MRLFTLAVLVLLTVSVPSAQTVTSFTLDTPRAMDAISTGPDGALYGAAGFRGSVIYAISLLGEVTTIASGLNGPIEVAQTEDGTFYATNFNNARVSRFDAAGEVDLFASTQQGPSGILAAPGDTLYVTQYGSPTFAGGTSVSQIAPDGTVEIYASGGTISDPVGIARSPDGTLYVANIFDGRITQIAPDGTPSLFASVPRGPGSFSITIGHLAWAQGQLFATNTVGHRVWVFGPDGAGRVYAGTGAAGQDDGPASSATFNQPNGIAASVTGDTLFVAELGGGSADRIRLIVPGTTAAESPPPSAPHLRLDSGYPNPFADATTLRFTLGQPAEVTLVVYDVLGREVDRVEIGARTPGTYASTWRPTGLAAGTYLLRLDAGAAAATRTVAYRP